MDGNKYKQNKLNITKKIDFVRKRTKNFEGDLCTSKNNAEVSIKTINNRAILMSALNDKNNLT